MKMYGMISMCIMIFISSFTAAKASCDNKIIIEALGIAITIPKDYQIIPQEQWKSDLALVQKFIIKNPFDFDFLIQKVNPNIPSVAFESSHFLIKSKKSRMITNEEFRTYIEKYFLNWESSFRERKDKGQISNLISVKLIQKPMVDYEKKTVILKSSISLDEINEIQYFHSSFHKNGNLIILFRPLADRDESDFDYLVRNIGDKY